MKADSERALRTIDEAFPRFFVFSGRVNAKYNARALCRERNEPVHDSFLVAPGTGIRIVSLVGPRAQVRVIQHGDNRVPAAHTVGGRVPSVPPVAARAGGVAAE